MSQPQVHTENASEANKPQLPPPPPDLRRIVTGHDEKGKAVVTTDSCMESNDAWKGVIRIGNIWTTQDLPTKDNKTGVDGAFRDVPGMGLVLPQGINHGFTDLAPGGITPMHRTNSVDYNILLSGRLILILGDNSETEVEAGNVVVQRGTMHAWRNPSETEWSRWVSVLIHAEAVEVGGKELEEVWDA